jgi:hypothetical protein
MTSEINLTFQIILIITVFSVILTPILSWLLFNRAEIKY